jgi:hypothetical protein
MVDFYSSWAEGLSKNKKALAMLLDCDEISGVETSVFEDHKSFQDAGLKVSFHDPFRQRSSIGLAHPGLGKVLLRKENRDILASIRNSDNPVVSFHLSHNMMHYIRRQISADYIVNVRRPEVIGKEKLVRNVALNLLELERLINKTGCKKLVAFETGGFYNFELSDGYDRLSKEKKGALKETIDMVSFLNSYEFLEQLFSGRDIADNSRIGYLFDISHVLCCASAHKAKNEIALSVEEYTQKVLSAAKGHVFEMHMNTPRMSGNIIIDAHLRFSLENPLSRLVLGLAKDIEKNNASLKAVTLEIDEEENPLAHARLLCSQAKLVRKELNF